jgi:histidine triad (HIT) family protein
MITASTRSGREAGEMDGCTFCAVANGSLPARIVVADDDIVAFLDRRPLFPGHVLVIPRDHVPTLLELDDRLLTPLFGTARRVAAAMGPALGAEGTFVAMNNIVSQSVPHLHVHVVPRRRGDGLRGFFWPRHHYENDEQADDVAARLRHVLSPDQGQNPTQKG